MILNKDPPSEFETNNKILNSGGTDMYIEHPYFYEGKYYANIDGEGFMIEDFPDLNCDGALCTDKNGTAGYSQSDQSAELRGTHDYLCHFL